MTGETMKKENVNKQNRSCLRIGMISLGCAKNRVDSEIMLGLIKNAGYEITNDIELADIVVVNTCGFIESSKEEGINALLDVAQLKKTGRLSGIIAAGCLAQRYGKKITELIPEVDAVVGAFGYSNICDAIKCVWERSKKVLTDRPENRSAAEKSRSICYFDDREITDLDYLEGERILTTPACYAYLKIAEGCSNRCTYCAIPSIRGPYRSRPVEKVVREAEKLISRGVKELVVVAQDTTMYGTDISGKSLLPELLEALDGIEELAFIRILYLYPDEITDEIIDAIGKAKKVVPYFDIPLQHINDNVLKRMNRRGNGKMYRDVIKKLRERIPGCIIRTSLITGFPGETEEEHRELLEFLRETRLERVGVFIYSREEGTPAARMKDQVHPSTKKRRYRELMAAQQEVSYNFNSSRVGRVFPVLVESVSDDGIFYIGRSYMEAPEEDGSVFFAAKKEHSIGDIVDVKVLVAEEYDVTGEETGDSN